MIQDVLEKKYENVPEIIIPDVDKAFKVMKKVGLKLDELSPEEFLYHFRSACLLLTGKWPSETMALALFSNDRIAILFLKEINNASE